MVTIREGIYKSVRFCEKDPRTPILCNQINQRLRLKLVNEMTVSNSAVVGSTSSGPKQSEFEARCSYQMRCFVVLNDAFISVNFTSLS